jgi:sugar phosphate isomerase/epimerase
LKISISNLAWEPAFDEAIASILKARGVTAIDVVPGKYVPDLSNPSRDQVRNVRNFWSAHGVSAVGMQALLFGTTGLNLFGSESSRQAMLAHLASVAKVGQWLGSTRLVFGSPRNRDRSGLSDAEVESKSISFFRQLGTIATDAGVIFCLEPNPAAYSCNFMTTTLDAAEVVRRVDHPGIRLQLDTGAIFMNGEDPADVIPQVIEVVGHIHLSEPNLDPLGSGSSCHEDVALVLASYPAAQWATIEMRPPYPDPEQNEEAIDRAIRFVISHYDGGTTDDVHASDAAKP